MWQVDIRVRAGAAEERELTFQPHINRDNHSLARPRAHAVISMQAPEVYMAVIMNKQQQRQLQHEHNVRAAEVHIRKQRKHVYAALLTS